MMKALFMAGALLLSAFWVGTATAQALSAPERLQQLRGDLAGIETPAEAVAMARQAESERDWLRAALAWERAARLRPFTGLYHYHAAANYAQADDKPNAYQLLLTLQARGYGFDLESDTRLRNLQGTRLWDHLVALNKDALETAFGDGGIAFELPPADLLLESIAWEPGSKSFLFGSARNGTIYRREGSGEGELEVWSEPQGDQWWSIFDIKVDASRNVVWATSAAIPHFINFRPELTGQSALLKIDRRNGRLIASYPAPDDGLPHILNTIAVSRSGEVVVAEGMRGQLFMLQGDELVPFMAERQLSSLRGLAFSDDGKRLYFADHERGLFGVDLSTRLAFDVAAPASITLEGIEGLYLYEGQLLVVQNGFRPQRVMRFKLDDEGRRIEVGAPIEANRREFAMPTLGTITDDGFYYIANSQRSYYDGFGLVRGGVENLPPVRVFRSDPRFNWDFEPPRLPDSVVPRVPE